MLVTPRCPCFLVGLNLAAHFLDEPSVQKLYEEQVDPKAISLYFLNDMMKSSKGKNLEFLQSLKNLLYKTENEFKGKVTTHLQSPPMMHFEEIEGNSIVEFDSKFPDRIKLDYKKILEFQEYTKEQEVLTSSFYVCISILHEISNWKMHHFGHGVISPLNFKGTDTKAPWDYLERILFGGCLGFDENQIYFAPDGKEITQQNKYVHFTSYEKFFKKCFWRASTHIYKQTLKQTDFKLQGFADSDSKRFKEEHERPGNELIQGPDGLRIIYRV
jgi:hypothetical protein